MFLHIKIFWQYLIQMKIGINHILLHLYFYIIQ